VKFKKKKNEGKMVALQKGNMLGSIAEFENAFVRSDKQFLKGIDNIAR